MSKLRNQVASGTRQPTLLEVTSKELRKRTQIEDFVWVEMAEADPRDQLCESSPFEVNSEEHTSSDINSYNISNIVQPSIDYDTPNIDTTNTIEDLYWEQKAIVPDKIKRKPKLQTSNRKTVKECNIIANNKVTPRHPSYYKFDDHTCHILETLPLKMGPLMNIAGKGQNSVVIYAECLLSSWRHYIHGYAVKVYKYGSDVKKNLAILKHIQNEEENLRSIKTVVRNLTFPHFVHRSKNVIVTSFIGCDQETAPSIDSISVQDYLPMYQSIVKDMDKWYNKADIVHGNLSTKNVVYFLDQVSYIGWSHSVRRKHPLALTKLMKDCHFVTDFFEKRGVPVKPTEELYKEIAGLNEISSKVLEVLHKKNLWKDLRQTNPNKISDDSARSSSNSRFKK